MLCGQLVVYKEQKWQRGQVGDTVALSSQPE